MRLAAVMLAALLLAACGDDAQTAASPTPTPTPRAAATPDDPCGAVRPEKPVDRPKGLLGPADVEIGLSAPLPPNLKVEGFIPLTPAQFASGIERRDEYDILFQEAEVGESEVMFTDGRHRNFWKVVKACPEGSKFTALVGDEPKRPKR